MISVLYVDDDPAVRDAAKSFLEREGDLALDPVESAEVALDKLSVLRYDAIISDYKMPVLNGIDFLRELRGRGNHTIYVMFTANGGEAVATEALLNGADHYVFKRGNAKEDFGEVEQVVRRLVQQKCNDAAIKHAESKYYSLLHKMHNGFAYLAIIADEKGRPQDAMALEFNEAFERLTGLKGDDLIGRKVSEVIRGKERIGEEVLEAMIKVAQTGEEREVEGFSSLTERWFIITFYSPEPGHVAAVLSDTTEAKRLAKDLEHSRELYRRLFDDFPNPIWRSGKNGGRTYVNPAWLKITGASLEEVLGNGWLENVHPDDRDRCSETYFESFKTKQPFEMEYRLKSKTGFVWILDTGRPFYELTGEFSGFIGSCYDITSRKENDDILQLANKKLKILGSITRHDLLNQLTALTGYIGIVQERATDQSLSNYLSKAMHASENIRKYLEFGRDYEKMGTNRPEWQSIQDSFNKGVSTVQLGDIRLETNLDHIEVYADQMFERVFHNLLDNACRHGSVVKNVIFDYLENEDGLVITCEDDGVGVTQEKRERLFSNRYGHGLYLVQEILGITGMTIKEVGRPSGGARFEIHVPKGNYRLGNH